MTRPHHPAEEGVGLDPDHWWTHGFPGVCVTGRQYWFSKSRPDRSPETSVGDAGLKTQVFEYLSEDRRVEVTYVDGLVVRFSVSSK